MAKKQPGPNPPLKPDPNKDSNDKDKGRQRQIRFSLSYLLVSLVGLWLFQQFLLKPLVVRETEIAYSEFKTKLKNGEITELTIGSERLQGSMVNPDAAANAEKTIVFTTIAVPDGDSKLIEELDKARVKYQVEEPPSPVGAFLVAYGLPLILIGALWYFIFRRASSGMGGGGMFGVGKSKATEVKAAEVGVTYTDVGGCDEAITELQEIIQFLKTPEKFSTLGGRLPKGVLLVGPPGTGKTLLAKATAGEAKVAFFETSGSEFIEMFVGVGAARVRDLFEQARKAAPAVIFIDEIDAIGQTRGGAVRMGGNDEREQTLNQLLAEIDGFKVDTGRPVIIMAATNRPEVLDPALLRAGRFDRQVAVSNPDLIGRQQILKIHSRSLKLARDFDLDRAARITAGFSGADLANVLNEAALLASRRSARSIGNIDFEAAIERVVAGLEKRSRVLNENERRLVAVHESGHALVAGLVPHADPVAKISIVPRGRGALGFTMQMPAEDRFLLSLEELEDRIAVMLGGRAAEKMISGTISTGASDDIKRATELARRMVTEFGMSEKLGSVRYAGQQLQYLGGPVQDDDNLSPQTRETIDSEIQRIITGQYERAQQLLQRCRPALDQLTAELLEKETLDGSAVKAALEIGRCD